MLLDDYQKDVVAKNADGEEITDLSANIRLLSLLLLEDVDVEEKLRYASDLLKQTALLISRLDYNLDTVAQNSLK